MKSSDNGVVFTGMVRDFGRNKGPCAGVAHVASGVIANDGEAVVEGKGNPGIATRLQGIPKELFLLLACLGHEDEFLHFLDSLAVLGFDENRTARMQVAANIRERHKVGGYVFAEAFSHRVIGSGVFHAPKKANPELVKGLYPSPHIRGFLLTAIRPASGWFNWLWKAGGLQLGLLWEGPLIYSVFLGEHHAVLHFVAVFGEHFKVHGSIVRLEVRSGIGLV